MTDFGISLRILREKTGLTQKELARRTNRADGSIISRIESGSAIPDPRFIQEIVNVLAASGISRTEIDELWTEAGFHSTDAFTNPSVVIDPIIVAANQTLEKLNSVEERELFVNAVRYGISLIQDFSYAKKLYQQRDWKKADEELKSTREKIDQNHQQWYLLIDELSGDCCYKLGHFVDAIYYYQSALWSTQEPLSRANILVKLGDAHRHRGGGDWEFAINRYTEAKEIFHEFRDENQMARCLRKIAGTLLYQGRPDLAEPLLLESYRLCNCDDNHREVIKNNQHLAWVYSYYGRWEEAVQLSKSALENIHEKPGRIKGLRYLGDALRLARRVQEAEAVYKEGLDLTIEPGVGLEIEKALIQLGLAKLYLKRNGMEFEALDLLNKALEIQRKMGEDFRVTEILSEVGNLWLKLGRQELAKRYLLQAAERFRNLGNVFHLAKTLALICELYYDELDFEKVLKTAHQSRELESTDIDYHLGYHLAWIEYWEGRVRVAENNFPEATNAWQKALKRASRVNQVAFAELVDEIANEVENLSKEISLKIAIKLCDKLLSNLRKLGQSSDDTTAFPEAVDVFHRLRLKLESVEPVEHS